MLLIRPPVAVYGRSPAVPQAAVQHAAHQESEKARDIEDHLKVCLPFIRDMVSGPGLFKMLKNPVHGPFLDNGSNQ